MHETEEAPAALQTIVDESKNIVFFGGAGVSTESGIPDFRSADGIYHQHFRYTPEQVVSHSFFVEHTKAFYEFYRERMVFPKAAPNPAHLALARLEETGRLKAVITQNIDGLHTMAGNREVLELHGSVHRNHCQKCGKFYGLDAVLAEPGIPRCDCGGVIKPDVVLYEESLDDRLLNRAVSHIAEADTLIIGGTSLIVYPAAGLIQYFRGRHLVLINKSATQADGRADLVLRGSIGAVLGGLRTG